MEENGLITKRNELSGKLEKIIYSITEEGRSKLVNWLSSVKESEDPKFEILLKIFFGGTLETQKNIDTITAFKEKYAVQLPVLMKFEEELQKILKVSPDHLYYYITVLFGVKIMNAYMEWAEEAIRLLKSSQNTKEM
jgi:DNA-binding HxlR family transcriptional regulator